MKTLSTTNKAQRTPTVGTSGNPTPSHEAIAAAAYYRAEQRGFAPGGELGDWLEAERELSQASLQE
jgi:hypothetical protein